ncbi:MAG: ABC transporter permease, partial [Chloroflexi bacterium]|nr:ABC transporter permease [Chloroflexota bacterium]
MRRRLPPTLVGGCILIGVVVLTALVSIVWTPGDPTHVDVAQRFSPPGAVGTLGTDQLGRDELSRLMAGARNTLVVGVVTVVIALGIGVPV